MNDYERVEKLLKNYSRLKTTEENLKRSILNLSSCENYPINSNFIDDEVKNILKKELMQFKNKRKKLEKILSFLNVVLNNINNGIKELDHDEREVLTLFYLNDLHWYEIEKMINMSIRSCQRTRKKAINKLVDMTYGKNIEKILS